MIKLRLRIGSSEYEFTIEPTDDGYIWQCNDMPELASLYQAIANTKMLLKPELQYYPDLFYNVLMDIIHEHNGELIEYPKAEYDKSLIY